MIDLVETCLLDGKESLCNEDYRDGCDLYVIDQIEKLIYSYKRL